MRATFVEISAFTVRVAHLLTDDAYSVLQHELMRNPQKGEVIKGCGGIRKIRAGDPARNKGKRSGIRIIYLYLPEVRRFYMIDIYGKNEKDDLSAEEKKLLRRLVDILKSQAKT